MIVTSFFKGNLYISMVYDELFYNLCLPTSISSVFSVLFRILGKKKIHREITRVRFKPRTLAFLEQMSLVMKRLWVQIPTQLFSLGFCFTELWKVLSVQALYTSEGWVKTNCILYPNAKRPSIKSSQYPLLTYRN